ncbi:MAG: glycosyltransferase, partial [bacterium]
MCDVMPRPRILHLIHHLRIGGAETLLVELLPRLAEAGSDVHVACLDDRGPLFEELQRRGIQAHFIGRKRGIDPVAIWRLVRLLRHLRIDILNT